jgi:hypothetical protein
VVELTSNTAEAVAADDAPTITFPLTVALFSVPTLVKLELTTLDARVVPVKVPALIFAVNTPFASTFKLEPTLTPPKLVVLAIGKEYVGIVSVVPDNVAAPVPVVDKVIGA